MKKQKGKAMLTGYPTTGKFNVKERKKSHTEVFFITFWLVTTAVKTLQSIINNSTTYIKRKKVIFYKRIFL